MATEKPYRPNYPVRSAFAPIRNTTPFHPSFPACEAKTSVSSPFPPFSSQFSPPETVGGLEIPAFRPPPPVRHNEPIRPPPPPPQPSASYGFPSPPVPPTGQLQPPIDGRFAPPPIRPPPGSVPSRPGFVVSQPRAPPIPMGLSPPQQSYLNVPVTSDQPLSHSRPIVQPSSSPLGPMYGAVRGNSQAAFPGYPNAQLNSVVQAPTMPPISFALQQGGCAPPRGYVSGPPMTTQPGLYSGLQQGFAPPMAASQGLAEDFSSLSLESVPGSHDAGLDASSLPRPLDGDVEPKSFTELFPMNCNSRYLRFTTGGIPNSQSLASRWHLPLGVIICPLAEIPPGEEDPTVDIAATNIIRCRRCRAYVNPYVTFSNGGRTWRCNLCSLLNEVPDNYFAHLDASGRRIDLDERPELTKGSVEFIASKEYMNRPPMPPVYFFLIDVSIAAVKSGMLEEYSSPGKLSLNVYISINRQSYLFVPEFGGMLRHNPLGHPAVMTETVKSCLDSLPGCPRTQIGFVTYNSTIHFYNMKSSLMQPQMLVVSDLDDIFVPLSDDLLVNLSESRSVVEAFLDALPSMFQDDMDLESAFGPALKAAVMIMSQLGGKLLIFQNSLPSLGVGHLRLRGDDIRAHGTDKEHTIRVPEDPFYKEMAADLAKGQIAVNVYAFGDQYTDIASLGTLSKYTGGQVYYYPSLQSTIHKDKLKHELARDLTRETAWEATLKIRCGRGVRFASYHGNFMLRSTGYLQLPAVDCDKAYAAQLSFEEMLLTSHTLYFQVALLYTSSTGERRIRVHTAAAPVVADLGEMYRLADTGAIISLFSRLAIEKTLSSKLEDARNEVQLRIVKAFREYKSLYAVQHRLSGRMIYPESLKFLPVYALALCKSTALRGGYADAQLDERCAAGHTVMTLPVKKLLKLLYPSLYRVDEVIQKISPQADEFDNVAQRLPLTAESLDARGLYIFDNGFRFVIWFGKSISPDMAGSLLEEDFDADHSKVILSERENEMSRKLMRILNKFRESDPSYYQLCHIVRQGEQPREGFLLLSNLVEDQIGGANGYADWILQLHRQVQHGGHGA